MAFTDQVTAEISPAGDRIDVAFQVEWVGERPSAAFQRDMDAVRSISGRRFDRSRKVWTIPLDWQTATELRRVFGKRLALGTDVRKWGIEEKARQRGLRDAAEGNGSVDLSWLRKKAPDLFESIWLGPAGISLTPEERKFALEGPPSFQALDVGFMVESPAPLNANHMGLGKTIETIASLVQTELAEGPVLVVAPVSAAEGTWPSELEKWLPDASVFLARGTRNEKATTHEAFRSWVEPMKVVRSPDGKGEYPGNPGWLIVNPEQIQIKEGFEKCAIHQQTSVRTVKGRQIIKRCNGCGYSQFANYPDLFDIKWSAVVFDEAHLHGVLSNVTQAGMGARKLALRPGGKKMLLTGTPMGGKETRIFEILQFLRPDVFTSKWRFAHQYLEVGERVWRDRRGTQSAKTIGGIRRCAEHREQDVRLAHGLCGECDRHEKNFFNTLSPYMLRHTKEEVLTELPPKQHVDLWCPFGSAKHEKQYRSFVDDAEVVIGNSRVTATNVLSEYVRLTQMSWGLFEEGMTPSLNSGKLQVLEGKLEEIGLFDPSSTEQVVIFSQFSKIVDLVHDWLNRYKHVPAGKLHGGVTKKGARQALKEDFQGQGEGGLRALVVSTKAGGTSLTLDRASHVFIIDETWNPDNEEQAEDRCHRASRIHQVTVYRLLTKGTIDEFRRDVAWDKAAKNKNVMDLRRIKLKED